MTSADGSLPSNPTIPVPPSALSATRTTRGTVRVKATASPAGKLLLGEIGMAHKHVSVLAGPDCIKDRRTKDGRVPDRDLNPSLPPSLSDLLVQHVDSCRPTCHLACDLRWGCAPTITSKIYCQDRCWASDHQLQLTSLH